MATYRTIDYTYGNLVSQLRLAQLVALSVQAVVLYVESDRMSLFGFLFPFMVVIAALYVVLMRWFRNIDGRYDFRQIISVTDNRVRFLYAFNLFGGFVLSLVIHISSPAIHSGLNSVAYNLAHFLSICSSLVCVGVEIFEAVRN